MHTFIHTCIHIGVYRYICLYIIQTYAGIPAIVHASTSAPACAQFCGSGMRGSTRVPGSWHVSKQSPLFNALRYVSDINQQ